MDPWFRTDDGKLAASTLHWRKGNLVKARTKATPIRLAKLLGKLGADQPSAPSTMSGTRGAGSVASPSSKGLGGAGLTPPPPVGGMQMQRNLFAKSQQPGQFKGLTTKSQLNPAGTKPSDLGLPPVTGLPKIGQASAPAAPVPAPPNFIPPPPPVTPAAPAPPESPSNQWSPPADFEVARPWSDQSAWGKTKEIAGQAFEGFTNPFGTGLPGALGLGALAMTPAAPLAIAGTIAGTAARPIAAAIEREYGAPGAGQVRTDMPTTAGGAELETGIKSREQFLQQYGGNLEAALADPVLRSMGVRYGVFPGGFSISNDVLNRGEWVPREGGGGEMSGEGQAWMQAMIDKARKDPEKYPELAMMAGPAKEGSLLDRNRTVLRRLMGKAAGVSVTPEVREIFRLAKLATPERASDVDRAEILRIVKEAQLARVLPWAVGAGVGIPALAASAVTPSEQQLPGMSGLGRLGLGLAGLYGGYKLSDKIGLPGWLGAMLGAGVLPGLVGGLTGGGAAGGPMGNIGSGLMGGIGSMAQNPLVGGALGYLLASKYPGLESQIPGGKWTSALLGATVLPGMLGGMFQQRPAYA